MKPHNQIELEKVGVEGLTKYVKMTRKERDYHVLVNINSYITLPPSQKGAHMSRFVESIEEVPTVSYSIEDLAEAIAKKVYDKHGFDCLTNITGKLPYERERPSGNLENTVASTFASYSTKTKTKKLGVSVNGILACPCSIEMCHGLSHNQRGTLEIEMDVSKKTIELLDVIEICNLSFSSPTFSLLKRPEEKQIVERIHKNPRFVEDVVRHCVELLRKKYSNIDCRVKCVSIESIHDHNVCSEWVGVL